MVFDSYTFLIFLAVVLPAYYGLRSLEWKRSLLLATSLYFYGAWNPPFTLLLLLCSAVAWLSAELIDSGTRPWQRTLWLVLGVGINLGMLAFFKYGAFLWSNVSALVRVSGLYHVGPPPAITLPVGISFFTFQAMSYTLDVYLRRHGRATSFAEFLLYVSFFPQLVAGPIVRFHEFAEQMRSPKPLVPSGMLEGMKLLIVGLFQKVVIADGICAPITDRVFDGMPSPSMSAAWSGVVAFATQIYCDFAGYSTAAIGTAMLFGYRLPVNFASPYGAVGFSAFWRRWHISLSTWLRDYLFIPLGGSRGSELATSRNLMITMVLGGLWHGASWTFVIWGTIHGALLVIERWLGRRAGEQMCGGAGHLWALGTFVLVLFTWVPFRSRSFESMLSVTAAMVGLRAGGDTIPMQDLVQALTAGACLFCVHRAQVAGAWSVPDFWHRLEWLQGVGYGILLYLVFTAASSNRNFIYFQF